jgi:hypothetical protein
MASKKSQTQNSSGRPKVTAPVVSACAALGSFLVAALSLNHSIRTSELAKAQQTNLIRLVQEQENMKKAMALIAKGKGGQGGAGGTVTIMASEVGGEINTEGGSGGRGGGIELTNEAASLLGVTPEPKKAK